MLPEHLVPIPERSHLTPPTPGVAGRLPDCTGAAEQSNPGLGKSVSASVRLYCRCELDRAMLAEGTLAGALPGGIWGEVPEAYRKGPLRGERRGLSVPREAAQAVGIAVIHERAGFAVGSGPGRDARALPVGCCIGGRCSAGVSEGDDVEGTAHGACSEGRTWGHGGGFGSCLLRLPAVDLMHERAQQVCLALYLVLNMDLCAMVGLLRGSGPAIPQGSGVGLQQGAPMGVGGEAMVGHVRA